MRRFIIFAVVLLAVGGAFYGGVAYARSKAPGRAFARGDFEQLRNSGDFRGGPGDRRGGAGTGASGEIISKDDKSITVKLRDGGSRIVFFSDATGVTKVTSTTPADLAIGKTVFTNGKTNTDGSVTADTIQLR